MLAAAGALLAAPLARAQARIPTLGVLSTFGAPPTGRVREAMMKKAIELGWREGETIRFERAYGDGDEAKLPALAAELVRKNVDVIWVPDPTAAVAAARATKTIPIVFFGVAFAVEQGLADSLARPGRNATGVSFYPDPGLVAKKLEFLKQAAPKVTRVALLYSQDAAPTVSGELFKAPQVSLDTGARQLKIDLRHHLVSSASQLEAVFAEVRKSRAQALATIGTMLLWRERQRIADFALKQRLPSAFALDEFAEAGGLLSYGPTWTDMLGRSLDYVDRIFKGAKPAELPIQQPSNYELVLNQRTANAIGIRFPQSLIVRASRIID